MKKFTYRRNVFSGLIILFIIPCTIKATALMPSDSVPQQKESSHSVFLSTGYGENLILGSTISKPQSYFHGALTYGFKNEFFLSATSFYLPDYKNVPAFNVFSAIYSHVFNSWFDISVSLSGFNSPKALSDTLFSSFLYGDFTLGLDWRILYTKLSVSRVLSHGGSTFLQAKNSKYFQTRDFYSGKLNVSFDPYCNLLLGSLTKIITTEGTSIGVDSPVWTGGGYGSGSGSGSGNGPGNGTGGGTSGTPSATTTTSVYFGLMEIDFGLPISLNTSRVVFEIEPGYVLPMFTDPSIPNPEGFSMMCNLYIKIL